MTYHKATPTVCRPPQLQSRACDHPTSATLSRLHRPRRPRSLVYCVSTIDGLFRKSQSYYSFTTSPPQGYDDLQGGTLEGHASSAGSIMMSQKSILVQVVGRNGKEIIKGGVQVPEEATLEDLKKAIQSKNRKYYPERQRITLPLQPGQTRPTPVDGAKKLKDTLSSDAPTVALKDLGPQVSYKILFFFEYLGPLLIFPFFYFYPQVYTFLGLPERKVIHPVQTYALYAWCFHYAKRELETFFVHRFSHATSPISNVYRNCAYYWLFGAYIAYFVNHPLYTPVSEKQMYIGFGISVVSQLANFYCHILLKNLRSPDGKGGYQIPTGFLFNFVTCANYTTEIWQWIGFNIATQTVAGYLFLAAAGFIMTVWALQKHKRLKKTFDGKDGRKKYPRRWVIFPPLL